LTFPGTVLAKRWDCATSAAYALARSRCFATRGRQPVMSKKSKATPGRRDGQDADGTASRAFMRSLIAQAMATVAIVHGVLLPLFYWGLLSALQFAVGALVLSCLGIA